MQEKIKDDTISRQAAIDAIAETVVRGESLGYGLARDIVYDLPSVQPEPRWIPCSERLPESGRYLVSCQLSVFSPQVLNYDENNGEWFYDGCKSMDFEMPTINAWMPLPEPPKEEHT